LTADEPPMPGKVEHEQAIKFAEAGYAPGPAC
jgi:hypothetical protein